jgi:DNA polymerase-3 subunit beta
MELTGFNFLFESDTVRIAATDSFRLGEQVLPIPETLRGEAYPTFAESHPSLILPFITAQEIIRAVSADTTEVRVAFEENQAFFDVDGLRIVSRIINGKYPDYRQIIPKEFLYSARISREELLRAVRLSSVFASQINGEMSLSIDPAKHGVVLDARSSDIGENRTTLSAEVRGGEPIQAVFNPRYLIDGLNVLDTDEILFQMNTASSPAALHAVSDDPDVSNFLYIAMPIRK